MPYNRMYNELLPPENESMSDLTRTLIGIQMRREEKTRQAKLDALFEERQRQSMQMAQDEQQAKAADILASIAAAGDRPKEQLPPVQMPVGPPSTPSDMAAFDLTGPPGTTEPNALESAQEVKTAAAQPTIAPEVATPTPIHKFQFGGQTIERPLYDMGELANIHRKKQLAEGAIEMTPEMIAGMPPELQSFFQPGSIQPPPNLSSTMAAIARRPQGKTIERVVNLGDRTEYIYTDGTREMIQNGPTPRAASESTTGEDVDFWVKQLQSGSTTLQNVPTKLKAEAGKQAMAGGGIGGQGFIYNDPKQKDKLNDLFEIRHKAEKLQRLLGDSEVVKWFGRMAGRVGQLQQDWFDSAPPNVREAYSLASDLSDKTLRQRSGAAINEQEYQRIIRFTTEVNAPASKNLTNLSSMLSNLSFSIGRLTGTGGFQDDEAPPPPGGAQNPQGLPPPPAGFTIKTPPRK